ncbi:MAG: MmcQ/YjbR family DNA-binding protein [Bacteroidetes bacterium]|nr:MmcQ/YjbR family DNA-binding protein [Bacteroidota bacterium]
MYNIEIIRDYCIAKDFVNEGFPFGADTLVFRTKNKLFLLLDLNSNPPRFNVKCKPELCIELREMYPENILPGYHMNKKHWNTVVCTNKLPKKLLFEMIDNSYNLIKR